MKILTTVLIAAALYLSGCDRGSDVLHSDMTDAGIMELVTRQCAIVPRHSGSPGCARTAELLKKESSLIPGVQVREESFLQRTPSGMIRFRNIIAEFPGRSDHFVLVGAHYDAKRFDTFRFEAANDGASGCAAMLVMMRALSRVKLKKTVRFIFFDGEEAQLEYSSTDGLHGSRDYAEKMKKQGLHSKCDLLILLDMVGDSDLQLKIPSDTPSALSVCAVKAAEDSGHAGIITEGGPVMLDDHVPFKDLGIPSLLLIDFSYGPGNSWWHTPLDTPEKVSSASIRASAETALEVLRQNRVF